MLNRLSVVANTCYLYIVKYQWTYSFDEFWTFSLIDPNWSLGFEFRPLNHIQGILRPNWVCLSTEFARSIKWKIWENMILHKFSHCFLGVELWPENAKRDMKPRHKYIWQTVGSIHTARKVWKTACSNTEETSDQKRVPKWKKNKAETDQWTEKSRLSVKAEKPVTKDRIL